MPRSGKVASRVNRPKKIRVEQPSSKVADMVAATSGLNTGTRYSLANRRIVVCQLRILLWPDMKKTLAVLKRKMSCSKASGKRPSRSRIGWTKWAGGWRRLPGISRLDDMEASPQAMGSGDESWK